LTLRRAVGSIAQSRRWVIGFAVSPGREGEIMRSMKCIVGMLCALLFMTSSAGAAAVVLPAHSTIAGKTLQEYAGGWYQYIYSVPQTQNPLLDDTGANAHVNQSGPVFYLVGKVDNGSGQPISVERSVTVSDDKYLFFPLININTDNVFEASPKTIDQLTADAKANIDGVSALHASIDSVDVPDLFSHREQSPPFDYVLPDDNIYAFFGATVPAGTVSPAVADGYWLMVAPLAPGLHDINFGGTNAATTPNFVLDVTYHVTVEASPAAIPLPMAIWPGAVLLSSLPIVKKLRRRP